jgi:aminopeptidase
MNPEIKIEDLKIWAGFLLDYSLGGINPEDIVMIKGEHITWPLMSILQDKIISSGAIADIMLVPPDNDRGKVWGAAMARYGNIAQIERTPPWLKRRYDDMTKYIEILGSENPGLYANLPEHTSQEIMKQDEPYKTIRLLKPWVLTLFPTKGFAEMEGMAFDEYTDFIVRASTTDPRELNKIEEDVYQVMKQGEVIKIQTVHPEENRDLELSMNIKDKNIIKCAGEKNFPDGEVFTSPDANTVEGEIYVDLPVSYTGVTIQGIYLQFLRGKIEKYSARSGQDALKKIIETDAGSHRLGEVALGMNQGIQKVLKHPLFVEKVGGTLHIAIGASYPECFVDEPSSDSGKSRSDELFNSGILNLSAQHLDIVTDFRPGGVGKAVFIDDVKLEIKNNIWIVPDK